MVTLSACSAISGSSSATSACRGNRGVDVNLDDFMLSSVVNDKKLECSYHTADAVEMQVLYTIIFLLKAKWKPSARRVSTCPFTHGHSWVTLSVHTVFHTAPAQLCQERHQLPFMDS